MMRYEYIFETIDSVINRLELIMPNPSDWRSHHVEHPQSDNDYFERMSRVVFMSGLNWKTLEKKWPGIKTAFAGFDIETVSHFDEAKIDALMANPDVIRNLSKIKAIVSNAEEMDKVIQEYGSFERYLERLQDDGGEDGLRSEISKRFAFMGKGTTVIFLYSVGLELPKASEEWQDRHA
jgi:DNA-3-methyladenine glycosylase I